MRFARYAIAVVSVGVAVLLTRAFPELLSTMRLFFFWCAVLFTAFVAGTGPAMLAIVLATLGAAFAIFPPMGSLALHQPVDVLRLVLFVLFAGSISAAVGMRRRAEARAAALSAQLQDDLEVRKRHEENATAAAIENARLFREAEEANRTKDEFLATLSHELRTPLTAISGWANMLQLGLTDETTTRLAIDTIARSARQQGELIDDLLDLSRVVAGTLYLDVVTLDLAGVVEQVIDAARPAAEAKGLSLELKNEASSVQIRGDDRRVRQIVWNLVTNAVKFTDESGSIVVTLSAEGGQARLEVRDSGKGIAPEFLPHVWERFRQADSSTSRQYGGLGLGLSVVRHLVELHGGTVSAASEGVGRGATFLVELPLARPVQATEAQAAQVLVPPV